jgi:hypothetical protein
MLTPIGVMTVLATSALLCGILYMLAVRTAPQLRPATVFPFAPGSANPADDTLDAQAHTPTVLADDGWKVATLHRLCDVEDLLDSLEAHGIAEREVQTMGNAEFRVRWK